MLDFVLKGGVFMYPIIACSVITIAIVLERSFHLKRAQINVDMFLVKIAKLITAGRFREVSGLVDKIPGPVAHIAGKSIELRERSRETRETLLKIEGSKELRRLEKHLRALGLVAHVSPLLGLLGTVTGMIKAFMKINELGGSVDAAVLAGGIWEALMTTAAGLTVAIPTLIFYHYFEGKIDAISSQMKEAVSRIEEWCKEYKNTTIFPCKKPLAVSVNRDKNEVRTHGI